MGKILALACVVAVLAYAPVSGDGQTFPSVPPVMMRNSAKVRCAHGQGSGTFIGPREVLTALHVIQSENDEGVKQFEAMIEVEIRRIVRGLPVTMWLPCTVKRHDANYDLAILEVDTDLPSRAPVAASMPEPGAAVFIVGCPVGANVTPSLGFLATAGGLGPDSAPWLAETSANSFLGNSGGGVWNANTGELIGVLVQFRGARTAFGGFMAAPNGSLFVPIAHVRTLMAGKP